VWEGEGVGAGAEGPLVHPAALAEPLTVTIVRGAQPESLTQAQAEPLSLSSPAGREGRTAATPAAVRIMFDYSSGVGAAEEEASGVEEAEVPPSPLPLSSPHRSMDALGSSRPRPPRRSMGLVLPRAGEEEDGDDSTLPAPVSICYGHRTAAAAAGLHGATRCACYPPAAAVAPTLARGGLAAASPAVRLAAALDALKAADADPRSHLAAMAAAVQLGLLGRP
jgi:hypothetical protein